MKLLAERMRGNRPMCSWLYSPELPLQGSVGLSHRWCQEVWWIRVMRGHRTQHLSHFLFSWLPKWKHRKHSSRRSVELHLHNRRTDKTGDLKKKRLSMFMKRGMLMSKKGKTDVQQYVDDFLRVGEKGKGRGGWGEAWDRQEGAQLDFSGVPSNMCVYCIGDLCCHAHTFSCHDIIESKEMKWYIDASSSS